MKKTILALSFIFFSLFNVQATHLMGGDIGISKDNNGNFILEHINFRDTLGIPSYAQTEFNAYKWDTTNNQWASIIVPTGMSLNMPMDSLNSGGLLIGIPYGIEFYKYRSNVGLVDSIFALNGEGKYLFFTEDCCRNLAILNMTTPGSEKLVISCEYTYSTAVSASQQSPEFLAIPIIYGPINQAWIYNPLPFDSDGDSLSWAMNTPYGSFSSSALNVCAGYVMPSAALAGPFTLNTTTGQVNWTPNMVGNFVASFKITEYKNGVEIGSVIRDMQYVVVPDSNSSGPVAAPEFESVSNYNNNTQSNYFYYDYYHNQPLTFTVGAKDPINPNDVLQMQAFCELFNSNTNAVFNYVQTGLGNGVNGTFTWTPTLNDNKDYILVVRANDGSFSKDFTIVLRHNPVAPTSTKDVSKNGLDIKIFPNPATVNGNVTLKINSSKTVKNAQITIVNLLGKVVLEKEVEQLNSGVSNINIDNSLQAGFYFVKLVDPQSNKANIVKLIVR